MSCPLLSSGIENLHLRLQSGKREASEPVCIHLKISCISTWKLPVKGRGWGMLCRCLDRADSPHLTAGSTSQQGAWSTGTEEV